MSDARLVPINASVVFGRMVPVSLLRVPAGFPSPAGDDLEEAVDPMEWMIRSPSSTFWWRVDGFSLERMGIMDGDMVAIDRAGKRRPGRIVLALVDGGWTLKVLIKRDGRLYLEPRSDNPDYRPILVSEDVEIWGVLAGVARRCPVE